MPAILDAEQAELVRQATELRDRLTRPVQTIEEAREQARKGAARRFESLFPVCESLPAREPAVPHRP